MNRVALLGRWLILLLLSLACTLSFSSDTDDELNPTQVMQTVDALHGNFDQDNYAACNRIALVIDKSLPDGTAVGPGEELNKQWELINGGDCTWTADYQIAEVSPKDHSIIRYHDFSGFAQPGEKTYAVLDLEAPDEPGNYVYYYMMVDEMGRNFGSGDQGNMPFWIDFKVTDSDGSGKKDKDDEDEKDSEDDEDLKKSFEEQPEETPCLLLGKARDITLPDGTQMKPGEEDTKTWELTNAGTCTWDDEFEIVDAGGDFMKSVKNKEIGKSVKPGGTVQISVPVVAPDDAGTYYNYWRMRSSSGETFGGGEDADAAFWLKIVVVEEDDEEETKPKDSTKAMPVTVNWGMAGLTQIGLGKCPTAAVNPQFNLTLTSSRSMTVTFDFDLTGTQTYPEPQAPVSCSEPANNNLYLRELTAGVPLTVSVSFTNCNFTNYVEGTIVMHVYEKGLLGSTKLGDSSISYTHTCGK